MARSRSPKVVAFSRFSHCLMAFVVLMKGISKADDLTHNWPLVALCCSFGVLIFLLVLFHHQMEKTWLRVSPPVSLLEGIVAVALGVYSLRHGQHLLPYAWFLAGIGAMVGAVVQWLAPRKTNP